jgi:sulfide:quinone oxidoreductase
MNSTTTLILGGGFGGIAAAHTLRTLLPGEHKIILIDKSPHFIVGATKTWVMLGIGNVNELTSMREKILPHNVEFAEAEITGIDRESLEVETNRGIFRGDYMIIGLGADLNMAAIPGLDKAAHSFYTIGDALRLQYELQEFKKGEIVILIPRIPFKCPPAPYEAALMLDDHFKRRALRDQIALSIYTIEPGPMSTAGPEMSALIHSMVEERAISYHPLKTTESVDENRRVINFTDGSYKSYDLLIAIPPHHIPPVINDAGLCNASGWIPVDPRTMKIDLGSSDHRLYAIGDNTAIPLPGRYKPDIPLMLPKAGVFAASHGIIAAKQIASSITGKPMQDEFDGKGYCYIETGGQEALKGEGAFFDLPHPHMSSRIPDKGQFQDKVKWIESWLKGKVV